MCVRCTRVQMLRWLCVVSLGALTRRRCWLCFPLARMQALPRHAGAQQQPLVTVPLSYGNPVATVQPVTRVVYRQSPPLVYNRSPTYAAVHNSHTQSLSVRATACML